MQLGWVDFSKEDRDKVFDVMNLLHESGSMDVIGIGTIRDAFANMFFPGTSTNQTVAKYFLIVPYILKEATEGRYGNDILKIKKRINKEEEECCKLLLQNCPDENGIIGRRASSNEWVSRKPSTIYWNGICTYGICTLKRKIQELLKAAVALQMQKNTASLGNMGGRNECTEGDDADAGRDVSEQLLSVPKDYYSDWRNSLTIRLTASEAAFLRESILNSVRSSLLGYLLLNNIDVKKYSSFEAVYEDLKADVPGELAESMRLACEFNRLVYTARVRYNYILSDGQNEDALSEWEKIESKMPYMLSVDIGTVFQLLNITNPRLQKFLTKFKTALQNGDIDTADKELRDNAKFPKGNDDTNDNWIGGRYLDYRFHSAKRIITDIYNAEEASHV